MKPHQLSLTSIVCQVRETLSSAVDDETVLLSIKNSKYYGMDVVATRIWNLTAQPIKVADIIQTLRTDYNVEEGECINDVLSFLQSLYEEKLLRLGNE